MANEQRNNIMGWCDSGLIHIPFSEASQDFLNTFIPSKRGFHIQRNERAAFFSPEAAV